MEKLDKITESIFDVGLKEWRISVVFVDGSDSSFSVFRIIAPDKVVALKILSVQIFGIENEEEFQDRFGDKSIDDLNYDESNTYYLSPKWDEKPSEEMEIALYDIDPFDCSFDLLKNYKNKFQWEE